MISANLLISYGLFHNIQFFRYKKSQSNERNLTHHKQIQSKFIYYHYLQFSKGCMKSYYSLMILPKRMQRILHKYLSLTPYTTNSPRFCFSDKNRNDDFQYQSALSPQDQDHLERAVLSMFASRFFQSMDESFYLTQKMSMREALTNQQFFKQFMVKQINKKRLENGKNKDSINSQWLDKRLKQKNYKELLKPFKINGGYRLNPKIWNQDRMYQITYQNKVTLNPLMLYKFYFNRLVQKRRYLISGDKGIGKSFSFIAYSHLSSFYHRLPFKIGKKEEQFIEEFTSYQDMESLTRIVYINASHRFNLGLYFGQLIHQFQGIYSAQEILADNPSIIRNFKGQYQLTLDQMSSVLNKLFKKIGEDRQNFVVIIDQANIILRSIRQILKMIKAQRVQILLGKDKSAKQPHKFRASQQYKDLVQYNQIIQLLISRFSNIIFHSSQQQYNLLNQFTQSQKKDIEIIDLLWTTERIGKFLFQRYNYSDYSRRLTAQFQLYKIFFFEIEVICNIHNFSYDTMKLKQVFDSTFLLNTKEKTVNLEKWKNDVRFLHIRQYLKPNGVFIARELERLMKTQSQQERRIQLSKYFIELKADIQKERLKKLEFQNVFLSYVTKSVIYQKSLQRHLLILDIYKQVISEIQRCSKSQQTEPNEFIYVNDDMPYDEKHILASAISFAHYNKQRKALVFQFSPSNMFKILTKIVFTNQYNGQLTYLVNSIWLQNQKNYGFLSHMLNNLANLIFKSGKFSISFKQFHYQQSKQFKIENSQSFVDWNQFQQKGPFTPFEKCFSLSSISPGAWIAGYSEQSIAFSSKNELFNNILMKRKENGYEMIAFIWTFEPIDDEACKRHQSKLKSLFEQLKMKESVNLTVYVVAPKYLVINYMTDTKKKDMFFAYQPQKPTPSQLHSYTYNLAYFEANLPFTSDIPQYLKVTANLLKQIYGRNQYLWNEKK